MSGISFVIQVGEPFEKTALYGRNAMHPMFEELVKTHTAGRLSAARQRGLSMQVRRARRLTRAQDERLTK
jgi:hypothetical protein